VNLGAEELGARIAAGEGRELEFKRGLPKDARIARTLCAFANTRGGLLLVGVGDRGELVGAPRPRETLAGLRRVAAERLEPALAVEAGVALLSGVRVAWCSIPLSPARPHAVIDDHGEREIVVRVGASNRRASGATLAAIRAQRAAAAGLDDLQRDVLRWLAAQPGGTATVAAFAAARNVGRQRARRAFTQLEIAGRLVGHGAGARRAYGLA
jgi:hypothetical protein